jgi:hypothetical protein
MFITKKHLSRRTVLRGVGVSVALPLLDSMLPAQTPLAKTAANSPSKLVCIEIVHGDAGSTLDGGKRFLWAPQKTGKDFEIIPTSILQSLQPFKDYLTIVSHTDCRTAMAWVPAEEGGDHFRSSAAFLTAAHAKMTEGADIYLGTSIDQVYAQKFGQDTPLPSIQLCIEAIDGSGACDYGYSCVYSDTISWASPTTPLPMERDPRKVFESLFGDGGTAAQRAARQRENASVLDSITESVARLQKTLPPAERATLDTYLDNVREVERRIQRIEKYNSSGEARQLPTAPIGVPDSFEEHVEIMYDLQVLALLTGITRVSAFKLSRDVCQRTYPESGSKTTFHSCSHHGENVERIDEFAKINRYHVKKAAYFLDKLKNTPDGDGSLLDHALVFYGSPMGDANVHNHLRVPIFIAGHANGAVKGSLHLQEPDGTPMANVLRAVGQKLGLDLDRFGDSTHASAI